MKLNRTFRRLAAASLTALTLGGCAKDITGYDGMQYKSTTALLFNHGERAFNPAVAKSNVIDNAVSNPNPVVSEAAKNIGCIAKGETGERQRRRDDLAKTLGQAPRCTR